MPRYRVRNRITKETHEVEAPFAQDACERLNWMIGNCHVELLREGPYTYSAAPSVPEYDLAIKEYVATAMTGAEVYGATWTDCEARLREANRAWIEHCKKCQEDRDGI